MLNLSREGPRDDRIAVAEVAHLRGDRGQDRSRLEPDSGEVCNYPHLRVGDTGENIAQPFLRIDVALIWWTPPLPASQCAKCGCRKSYKGDRPWSEHRRSAPPDKELRFAAG